MESLYEVNWQCTTQIGDVVELKTDSVAPWFNFAIQFNLVSHVVQSVFRSNNDWTMNWMQRWCTLMKTMNICKPKLINLKIRNVRRVCPTTIGRRMDAIWAAGQNTVHTQKHTQMAKRLSFLVVSFRWWIWLINKFSNYELYFHQCYWLFLSFFVVSTGLLLVLLLFLLFAWYCGCLFVFVVSFFHRPSYFNFLVLFYSFVNVDF